MVVCHTYLLPSPHRVLAGVCDTYLNLSSWDSDIRLPGRRDVCVYLYVRYLSLGPPSSSYVGVTGSFLSGACGFSTGIYGANATVPSLYGDVLDTCVYLV